MINKIKNVIQQTLFWATMIALFTMPFWDLIFKFMLGE